MKRCTAQQFTGADPKSRAAQFNRYGDEGEEPNWWFHLFREANEKDIADGEANSIGETMSSTAIVISFCPFCGKLFKNKCKR
jgi:hypothetical protein